MSPESPQKIKDEMSKQDWRLIAGLEWSVEDWTDYYHGVGFALWKIARRHSKKPADPVIDYQI